MNAQTGCWLAFLREHARRRREVAALEERERDVQVREPQHVGAQVDLRGRKARQT